MLGVNALSGGSPIIGSGLKYRFLSHLDGTNGSQTFVDELGATMTAEGNAQITTAQSVFGGASAAVDGAGDAIVVTGAYAPADKWTYGFRFRITSFAKLQVLVQHSLIGGSRLSGDWRFLVNTSGQFNFAAWNNSSSAVVNITRAAALSLNTWYEGRITKDTDDWYLGLDGLIGASVLGADIGTITNSANMYIAKDPNVGNREMSGFLDEMFMVDNALSTDDYTVPASPFEL